MKHDPVNAPRHYTGAAIEPIDAIEAALGGKAFVAYCRGQAMKYAWRASRKGKAAEDLRKGAWYLTRGAATADRLEQERIARALARTEARWWEEQRRTYALAAVVMGEDAGQVKFSGRRRPMTFGQAAMFTYWMSKA